MEEQGENCALIPLDKWRAIVAPRTLTQQMVWNTERLIEDWKTRMFEKHGPALCSLSMRELAGGAKTLTLRSSSGAILRVQCRGEDVAFTHGTCKANKFTTAPPPTDEQLVALAVDVLEEMDEQFARLVVLKNKK